MNHRETSCDWSFLSFFENDTNMLKSKMKAIDDFEANVEKILFFLWFSLDYFFPSGRIVGGVSTLIQRVLKMS